MTTLRTLNSDDVAIDDVVQAKQHNELRDDVLNALSGIDYASQATILASSPAVGDTAFAIDTGALYLCLVAATWTLWVDPPGQAPSSNYWDGLKLTLVANSFITVGRGSARNLQDTASINQETVPYTKMLDTEWSAGIGGGMRDPNFTLAAKRWFNLYLLGQSGDPDAVDLFATGIATDSELISSLPVGWNTYAFIGAVYWDGGGIREFIHRGREFRWKLPQLDVDADTTGSAGSFKTVTLSIPATGKANTLVRCIVSSTGGGAVVLRTPGTSDTGTDETTVMANRNAYVELLTDANGQIEYTMLSSWGEVSITTVGWDDERGFTMIIPADQTLQVITADSGTLDGGQGIARPAAVWNDETFMIGIADKGPNGGLPSTYAMNPTTHEILVGTQLNSGGNLAKLRGANSTMMVMRPDGLYAACFGRDKDTQVWHLVILDTSDPSFITEAGSYDISGDAIANAPSSTTSEPIWDQDRGRLWVPSNLGDIVIYDVSDPTSPSFVGTQAAAGVAALTYNSFRWSENKECLYATGSGLFSVLTPSGSGNSFTEDQITTFATTVVYATLAHDGTTIIAMGRSASDATTMNILAFAINPADETDVSIHPGYTRQLDLDGDITSFEAGKPRFATFRDDVFGAWHHVASTIRASQYVTYDFSDLDNPLFLEELIHLADPDNSHVLSSQYELFDGTHTQIFVGDVSDTATLGLSIVGYIPEE